MADDRNCPNASATSGSDRESVLGQIEGLQAQLDELRSTLDLPVARPTRAPASADFGSVRALIRARRKREAIFGEELFADPAWDVLLELYAASLVHRRVPTSELCKAAAVPATTGLRWIEKLHRLGLVTRHPDPLDARRVFVELTPRAAAAMQSYFDEVERGRVAI